MEACSRDRYSAAAFHPAEDQVQPTTALRASFSLLETVTHQYAKGLPIRWISVYGRLQNNFDNDHLRTAVGLATGALFVHVELGWTKYIVKQSEYSGPELLLGLGVLDIVGLYTRLTWLSNDQTIEEFGLRVNYPIWVGQSW